MKRGGFQGSRNVGSLQYGERAIPTNPPWRRRPQSPSVVLTKLVYITFMSLNINVTYEGAKATIDRGKGLKWEI